MTEDMVCPKQKPQINILGKINRVVPGLRVALKRLENREGLIRHNELLVLASYLESTRRRFFFVRMCK
jgi:hypothetical protein